MMLRHVYISVLIFTLILGHSFAENIDFSANGFPQPAVQRMYGGWVEMPKGYLEEVENPLADELHSISGTKTDQFTAAQSGGILPQLSKWEVKFKESWCNKENNSDCTGSAVGSPIDTFGEPLCFTVSGNYVQKGTSIRFETFGIIPTSDCKNMSGAEKLKNAAELNKLRIKVGLEADWGSVIENLH